MAVFPCNCLEQALRCYCDWPRYYLEALKKSLNTFPINTMVGGACHGLCGEK